MLLLALRPPLCREPSLSAKPKPLHKRQQALLQPVTLAFIPYKPYMPAVITHFQRYGRPQFFLVRQGLRCHEGVVAVLQHQGRGANLQQLGAGGALCVIVVGATETV